MCTMHMHACVCQSVRSEQAAVQCLLMNTASHMAPCGSGDYYGLDSFVDFSIVYIVCLLTLSASHLPVFLTFSLLIFSHEKRPLRFQARGHKWCQVTKPGHFLVVLVYFMLQYFYVLDA